MTDSKKIRAVFFDLDYTLVYNDLRGAIREVSNELERLTGQADFELLFDIACNKLDTGQYDRDKWWKAYDESLDDEQCARLSRIFWPAFSKKPDSQILSLLERLKQQGLILVLITNDDGVPGQKAKRIEDLEIATYFDLCLAGSDGVIYDKKNPSGGQRGSFRNKPDPQMFQYALEALDLAPKEVVMVGDKVESDLIPAHQMGMKAVLIISDRGRKSNLSADWSITIHFLEDELEGVIQEFESSETTK